MKQRGGRTGREGFIYSQTSVGAGAGAGAGVKAWKVGNRSDLPMLQIQAVLVCAYHLLNYSYTPLRKKKNPQFSPLTYYLMSFKHFDFINFA